DDHQRYLGVGGEEACPLADAVGGPVDPQQHGGAQQAVAAERVDDGHEGGTTPHAFVAAAVDGQLRRLVQVLGQSHPSHAPAEQAGPLEREQAVVGGGADLGQRRLDPRPRVHPDEHHRQVVGEAEQAIGLQHLVAAEALRAAQQDAGGQAVALADAEPRVPQERAAGPVALGEVAGELQAVLVHSAAPTTWPRTTAANPTTRDPSTLATPISSWSSWPSRWLPSIQVD